MGLISENGDVTRPATSLDARPSTIVHQSAESYLTSPVNGALDDLLITLHRAACSQSLPLTKINLLGYVDPEEDFKELVVQLSVSLATEKALTYWDHLGILIESWTAPLPSHLQEIVRERIMFDVQWDVSDPTT